jgi:microcystin-dependent protein
MRAWLTPDSSQFAETQRTRFLRVPGSLLYYVTGALMLLAESDNWEEFGDATPDETSQIFNDIFDDFLESEFQMVGQITAWVRDIAMPFGWLPMTGQTLAQADYPELTAVVPTQWLSGSNLILPDMRTRFLAMSGATGEAANLGNIGGNNSHTITIAEMPAHAHDVLTPLAAIPTANAGAVPAVPGRVIAPSDVTGNGNPFDNRPSYLSVRFGIYAGR